MHQLLIGKALNHLLSFGFFSPIGPSKRQNLSRKEPHYGDVGNILVLNTFVTVMLCASIILTSLYMEKEHVNCVLKQTYEDLLKHCTRGGRAVKQPIKQLTYVDTLMVPGTHCIEVQSKNKSLERRIPYTKMGKNR